MSEPRHLTGDELAQWKRVYERSGDRVSMHREFALALIATAEQLHTDADTLRQARQLAAQIQARGDVLPSRSPEKALLDLLAPPVPDTGSDT